MLFSYALAARLWGWYDGMPLHCRDGDEHLRELLQYVNRKPRARWTVQAVYHTLVSDPRTGEVNDAVVVRRHKPEDNYTSFSHWTWSLSRDSVDGMVWVQSWQHLSCLDVAFTNGSGARIEYMTDPDGRGFYYITAYDWIARCAGAPRVRGAAGRHRRPRPSGRLSGAGGSVATLSAPVRDPVPRGPAAQSIHRAHHAEAGPGLRAGSIAGSCIRSSDGVFCHTMVYRAKSAVIPRTHQQMICGISASGRIG